METKGYSQREIAELIGYNHITIHKIANAKLENLPISAALKLYVELNCTLDDIMKLVQVKEPSSTE
nr:helix-turn-helix transcriptional regulator [Polycladospora coralii]